MRILILHPETVPWSGEWAHHRWDLIVDLAYAGAETYAEWGRKVETRVLSIHKFAGEMESYRWVNQVFDYGRGRLLDHYGLDWWELLAMESYQDIHSLYLIDRLKSDMLEDTIELWVTKAHRLVSIAEQVFGTAAHYFQRDNSGSRWRRGMRAVRSAQNLHPKQVAEVVFDKWDADLQFRRRFAQGDRAKLSDPAVLLPSAYSNVTHSSLAYAKPLPQRKFLLATTRRSARPKDVPSNVTIARLASYAIPATRTRGEIAEIVNSWEAFRREMSRERREFRYVNNAGLWAYFPAHLAQGLILRDAWKNLLGSEPITGVLCGDDLNYHTRLPLALAQRSGLNAVYCSHGALDGGFLFKKPLANRLLVKGEMERNYLERLGTVPADRISIAAPGERLQSFHDYRQGNAVIFFSQPYEVIGGRAESVYTEIVPRLCAAARKIGRKVLVKLHPFESRRARIRLLTSILTKEAFSDVQIVEGFSSQELISQAWCGVTVDSSVAVDYALRKVPFFLCGWLDFTGMGYLQQFERFGVGRVLSAPSEIEQIPELVTEYPSDPVIVERLRRQGDPFELEDILFAPRPVRLHPCAC